MRSEVTKCAVNTHLRKTADRQLLHKEMFASVQRGHHEQFCTIDLETSAVEDIMEHIDLISRGGLWPRLSKAPPTENGG